MPSSLGELEKNSTAHGWVSGYDAACAAELIGCASGRPWSKGKWPPKPRGLSARAGERATILAVHPPSALLTDFLEAMTAKETKTKRKGINLGRFWNKSSDVPPPPAPHAPPAFLLFPALDGWIWLSLTAFLGLHEIKLHQSWPQTCQ